MSTLAIVRARPQFASTMIPGLLSFYQIRKALFAQATQIQSVVYALRNAMIQIMKSRIPSVGPFVSSLVSILTDLGARDAAEEAARSHPNTSTSSKRKEADPSVTTAAAAATGGGGDESSDPNKRGKTETHIPKYIDPEHEPANWGFQYADPQYVEERNRHRMMVDERLRQQQQQIIRDFAQIPFQQLSFSHVSPAVMADFVLSNLVYLPPFPPNVPMPSPISSHEPFIKMLLGMPPPPPSSITAPLPAFLTPINTNINNNMMTMVNMNTMGAMPTTSTNPAFPSTFTQQPPHAGGFDPSRPNPSLASMHPVPPSTMASSSASAAVAAPPMFIKPVPLTPSYIAILADQTFSRVIHSEKGSVTGGKHALWANILVKLASMRDLEDYKLTELVDYVAQDFGTRKEIALQLLASEYAKERQANPQNDFSHNDSRYIHLLHRFMEALHKYAGPKDRAVSSLLVESPVLPQYILGMFQKLYCTDQERVTLGLASLRDVILFKGQTEDGGRCLYIILSYASHPDEFVRSPAIRLIANQLLPQPNLTLIILQHATALLVNVDTHLVNAKEEKVDAIMTDGDTNGAPADETMPDVKPETAPTGDQSTTTTTSSDTAPTATTVASSASTPTTTTTTTTAPPEVHVSMLRVQMEMFFALCAKRPELITTLMEAYMNMSNDAKEAVHKLMPPMIKTIGMASPLLLNLIREVPKPAETFALHIIRILTDAGAEKPSPDLVAAVKTLHKRSPDARFLVPLIPGLEKAEVLPLLAKVSSTLPGDALKPLIQRMARPGNCALSPAELLVALHTMDIKEVPLKKQLEVVGFCLDLQHIYKQDVMAMVLQQLMAIPKTPPLFMRTVIIAMQRFPKMIAFIMSILSRLINKNVWDDERFWQGFVKCAQQSIPHSYPVLLQLPPAALEDLLKRAPEMKSPLSIFAKNKAAALLVPRAILNVLGVNLATPSSSSSSSSSSFSSSTPSSSSSSTLSSSNDNDHQSPDKNVPKQEDVST
eukprot:TRINITY_DN5309_c0_g1_i11.p1 TRINITY_DN5309_c0_g1~~TRINITY_DN5309_c0_g1_i11.p1  ORF type:complete len:998 (+),score=272.99 TRINITY_DN5309_c0_g1_i11:728-3721(+)